MNPNFVGAFNRAPAWKWNRANDIVSGSGTPTTEYIDTKKGSEWISRAVGFIQSYNRQPDPLLNNELVALYSDIYTAHSIFIDNSSLFRWELEAMILARVSTEELAISIDTQVAAIRAYEELFFDVRSKLDTAPAYVYNYVIGPDLQNLDETNYGPLWKLFGYTRGPHFLRAITSRTVNPQMCLTPDTVGTQMSEDIVGSFTVAADIAAKKRGCGHRGDKMLLQMFTKMLEVNKMEDLSSGSSRGQIAEHVQAVISTIPISGGNIPDSSPLAQYKHKSGEPQFSELFDMTIKGTSDTFEEESDFKFPVPIQKASTKKD